MCGPHGRSGHGRSWCGWMRFEIMTSPMTAEVDYARVAALELIAEVLDELPEGAVEDAVFRLALAVLEAVRVGRVWMPVTYFCLWMNRLMGWMPELGGMCGVRGPAGGRDGLVLGGERRRDLRGRSPPAGERGAGCGERRGGGADVSGDGGGAGGGGVAEGAGGGAAAVCDGDAGAASGAAAEECSGAGAGLGGGPTHREGPR